MFSVYYIPVFISVLQVSQVCSVESKLLGFNQIIEIDLNTLKGLLAADKLGDSLKRSSIDSGPAASLPVNTGIQSPISLPSNTQYSSLPIPLYFRKPNPVKKSVCGKVYGSSQSKVHRTPLAAASSVVSSTHYGPSSASPLPASSSAVVPSSITSSITSSVPSSLPSSLPSAGQKVEVTRNRYSTLSRAHADSTAKPAKSNQTLSSTSSVPTENAKSTEIDSAESVLNGASTVLSQAAYAAVSPNSHLAIAAPTSASGYGAGNMQALGQGASVAKFPGLKPLAIEEHQKAAFHDFTGALENHEFKPLTNQDVQNLPVVSHSALTGGAATAPQSQGGYSNQGNGNYGASPNQGYMQQYAGAAPLPSYSEGPAFGSFNSGLSGAQSYGGMPNVGQFYNNVQSGISQSYGHPSGSYENSNNQGWNGPLRGFIR